MTDLNRDINHLSNSQYATASKLQSRWNMYDFCVPPIDFHEFSLDALGLQGDEDIVELGCADGKVLLSLRTKRQHQGSLVGLEINDTIIKPAIDRLKENPGILPIEFIVGSADKLPFKSASFDVVLGFFMLYHMPDIRKTLEEWRRVLRPGGRLLVTTSSRHNRPKGKVLKEKMAQVAGVKPHEKFNVSFDLENAKTQLEEIFTVSDEYTYEGEMQINDVELMLEAVNSVKDMFTPEPTDEKWLEAETYARKVIESEIMKKGYFSDKVKRGYFICTLPSK